MFRIIVYICYNKLKNQKRPWWHNTSNKSFWLWQSRYYIILMKRNFKMKPEMIHQQSLPRAHLASKSKDSTTINPTDTLHITN